MDIAIKGDMDGIDTTHQINKLYDTPIIYTTCLLYTSEASIYPKGDEICLELDKPDF